MNFINKVIELFSTPKYMDNIWKGLETTFIISVLAFEEKCVEDLKALLR